MIRLCILLVVSACVCSESVRETETWMPMKTTETASMSTHGNNEEASGDSLNGSDFGFTDDGSDGNDLYSDTLYDDEDEYDEFSGSGDGATVSPGRMSRPSVKPDVNDNKIPELVHSVRPTINEVDIVQKSNEIPLLRNGPETKEDYPSNVLMSHASEDSVFNKKEVLAALIAGGAVGLLFAILPIALLIYCMKKKDEGSYDLGKKPIYKKAPTTEIYA